MLNAAFKNGCNKHFLLENFSSLGSGGAKTKREVKILDFLDTSGY
jgi:hypothetical protein